MRNALRGLTVLCAAGAILSYRGMAHAIEPTADGYGLTARERCGLERLIFMCRVRLAERQPSPAGAAAILAEAEKSVEWFGRQAAFATTEELRRELRTGSLEMAGHLAFGYGSAAALAARDEPETARMLLARRSEWLGRALPADASARELLELAELRFELGEAAGAAEVCRQLLTRHDPDGDGRGPGSELLPSFDELRAGLAGGGSFEDLGEVLAARAELSEMERWAQGARVAGPAGPAGEAECRRNLAKAASLAREFLKAHPGWDRGPDGQPGGMRRGLGSLAVEFELRDVLLRAGALLVTASGRLAREALEAGQAEEARRHAGGALAPARAAIDYRPDDAGLRLGHAWCLLAAGHSHSAAGEFADLRRGVIELGDAWWSATAGLWRALQASGERDAADRLAARLRIEMPEELRRRLPAATGAPPLTPERAPDGGKR